MLPGDVFACRLDTYPDFLFGQVVRDDIDFVGAKVLLVVFLAYTSRNPVIGCDDVHGAALVSGPFLTNRTGWRDGRFRRLQNCEPRDLGTIGLTTSWGHIFDDSGHQRGTSEDYDTLVSRSLWPYGAIALQLAEEFAGGA